MSAHRIATRSSRSFSSWHRSRLTWRRSCGSSSATRRACSTPAGPRSTRTLAREQIIDLAVQVNGKMRGTIRVRPDVDAGGSARGGAWRDSGDRAVRHRPAEENHLRAWSPAEHRRVRLASGEPDAVRRWRIAAWLLCVVGAAARIAAYAQNRSLWYDEAALALNIARRGFVDLVAPLDFLQTAPPLFLWAERAMVLLFGVNEWALRVVPLVCGILTAPMMWRVARRLLSAPVAVLAVALVALSPTLVRLRSRGQTIRERRARHAADSRPDHRGGSGPVGCR